MLAFFALFYFPKWAFKSGIYLFLPLPQVGKSLEWAMIEGLCDNDRTEGIKTSYFLSDIQVTEKEEITEILQCAFETSYAMESLFTMSKGKHSLLKQLAQLHFL